MHLRPDRFLFLVVTLAVFGPALADGQTLDTSGNHLLNGSFQFRHLAVQNVDQNFSPSEITASYGAIAFDGAGHYTITGTSVDNTVSGGAPQPLNLTGTYAIGANGAGYVANPLYPTDSYDYLYGAVSQGMFTGSATEAFGEGFILNDIFIAIPVGPAPANAGFTSTYQTGLLDFTNASDAAVKNALFNLSANGAGGFGTISLTGQAADQTATTLTQSITGATYNFNSDGSATLTVPLPVGVSSSDALFTGTKTMYQSADGNFILGWTAAGYDIFFGVKALAIPGTNSISAGLYFTSALEDGFYGVDSYYGATTGTGDSAGDSIVHQRLNIPGQYSFDYGTDDQINVNADGSTPIDLNGYQYVFGDGGLVFVAIGTSGNFSLQVGIHAATFSGTGVFLNPIGVANAASYQPITASLAPGELITLVGTGLSPMTLTTQGGDVFPLSLAGVSVTIDSIPCPIYYVSKTQLSVIVPYEIASNQALNGVANIQVNNNGALSNVVQMYFADSAPGSFSAGSNGIGYAAARHALTGVIIDSTNPAQPGEYISLYLTGLGTVTPTIKDGALGPSDVFSEADLWGAGNLSVYFNDYGDGGAVGNPATIQFAGLVPGLAGLYVLNVLVPAGGLISGDTIYVEIVTDAADVNQIQIPYQSPSGTRLVSSHVPARRLQHRHTTPPRIRRNASAH